jgi:hypothetical protein
MEVILLLDANETIGERPGGLSSVVGRLGLVDLIRDRHFSEEHIHTYSRGSKQIDNILGTKKVQASCYRLGCFHSVLVIPAITEPSSSK